MKVQHDQLVERRQKSIKHLPDDDNDATFHALSVDQVEVFDNLPRSARGLPRFQASAATILQSLMMADQRTIEASDQTLHDVGDAATPPDTLKVTSAAGICMRYRRTITPHHLDAR